MGNIPHGLLVLTLASGGLERSDENIERYYQETQHITGRMEKGYTPVEDHEISQVINRRLFSSIDEKKAKANIDEFLQFVEKEKLLPPRVDKSIY